MKFNDTLLDTIGFDLEAGIVPALIGEPGIGKSSFFESLAERMGTRCFTVAVNEIGDKADLTAGRLLPVLDDKGQATGDYGQKFFPMIDVMEAVNYAKANPREYPILFLDEINRTTSDITSAALSLPTRRKIGSVPLPENLRLAIAGNDKGNIVALDTASLSRFSIYYVEPDAATLIAILGADMNPWVREVLTAHPHLVFQKARPSQFAVDGDDDDEDGVGVSVDELLDASEEMAQFTTPRTIDYLSRWLNAVMAKSPDLIKEWLATQTEVRGVETTLLTELIHGKVGNTEFADKLIGVIASSISAGMTNAAAPTVIVPKPNCFAQLKSAVSIDELDEIIGSLNERERSQALLFAIHERADNKNVINQLAAAGSQMEPEDLNRLVRITTGNEFDRENLEVLRAATASPVSQQVFGLLAQLGV